MLSGCTAGGMLAVVETVVWSKRNGAFSFLEYKKSYKIKVLHASVSCKEARVQLDRHVSRRRKPATGLQTSSQQSLIYPSHFDRQDWVSIKVSMGKLGARYRESVITWGFTRSVSTRDHVMRAPH